MGGGTEVGGGWILNSMSGQKAQREGSCIYAGKIAVIDARAPITGARASPEEIPGGFPVPPGYNGSHFGGAAPAGARKHRIGLLQSNCI